MLTLDLIRHPLTPGSFLKLGNCLANQAAEDFLDLLLEALAIGVRIDPHLRRSVAGFHGRYRIHTRDDGVDVFVEFCDGDVQVRHRSLIAEAIDTLTGEADALRTEAPASGSSASDATAAGASAAEAGADVVNADLQFRDREALMRYFTSVNPDLFSALLRQDVVLTGNLTYVYRLAYLARHLELTVLGRL